MIRNVLAHRRNEQKHFHRLYDQVLNRLQMNAEITDADVSTILDLFKGKHQFKEGDLNNWAKICGYLYRYGAHGAGLAGWRVLEALVNCEPLRPIFIDRRFLKVLSVGGGSLNGVVGFLSAMSQLDQLRMDNGQMFYNRKMDIAVTDDTSPLWRDVKKETERLLREGDFGYVSEFSIYKVREIEFIEGTLPSRLRRYDVVIISKFINSLSRPKEFKLMRDLWSGLKESAFVLLIACPFLDDLWNDLFECLYVSDRGKCYSSCTRDIRFGHHNFVTSNARIAVRIFADSTEASIEKKIRASDWLNNLKSILFWFIFEFAFI